jgi:hypothetical protein
MNAIRFVNNKSLELTSLFTFVCKIASVHANVMLALMIILVIIDSAICGILFLDPKKANGTNNTTAATSPRTISLDPSLLASAKLGLGNNPILKASLKKLLLQANSFLSKSPRSVIDKTQMPASGDKQDYLSLSAYDWPDPTKPNGLPYILHDGIVNPEAYSSNFDRHNFDDMMYRVKILSLAYYFTDNTRYATKAEELLRVWFLNNNTSMNPHLKYAGMEPGKNNGSWSGVMDANNLPDVTDAIGLIHHSPAWTKQDQQGMEIWFSKYLDWLLTSDAGRRQELAINNHWTWYDVQISSIALFLNRTDIAKGILQTNPYKLISIQIKPDGRQPFELKRTNSWDYSLFNLQGLFKLASIGEHVGIDVWNYKNPQGAGLLAALNYLLPYSIKNQSWPYPQINPIHSVSNTKNLVDLLCQATVHYKNEESYLQPTYKSLSTESSSLDNLLYMCGG